MKMTRYIPLIAMCFLTMLSGSRLFSQIVQVPGKVINREQKAIPYSSVSLVQVVRNMHEQSLGTVSDETGIFKFQNVPVGQYLLQVSMVGFETFKTTLEIDSDFDSINVVLDSLVNRVEQVNVVGKKPLITKTADRYIMNISKSILSSGRSTYDLLNYAPGVMVRGSSISINGTNISRIMLNGKILRISGVELQNFLANVKSEDVEIIEVIPNPGAEFEAEGAGGILNIKLKKGKQSGWNGSFGLGGAIPQMPTYNGNFQLDYGNEKIKTYLSYNYNKRASDAAYADNRSNGRNSFSTNSLTEYLNRSQSYRIGASYSIGKAHSIGIDFMNSINRSLNNTFSDAVVNDIDKSQFSLIDGEFGTRGKSNFNNLSINYDWKVDSLGSFFSLIGDYTRYNRKSNSDFFSRYSDFHHIPIFDSVYRNSIPVEISNYNISGDFSKRLSKGKLFKFGARYTSTNTVNDIRYEYLNDETFVIDVLRTNRFDYLEKIIGAYGQFSLVKERFSFQSGLRIEKTISEGNSVNHNSFKRKFYGFFPSLYLKYTLNENSSLSLRANRRVERPTFNILNPFEWRTDDYTYVIGNPDLKPQYVNSANLSYQFKNKYDISLFASILEDSFGSILIDNQSSGLISRYRWENIDLSYSFGLNLYAPINLTNWWSMTNNIMFYRQKITMGEMINNRTILEGKSSQFFSLKDDLRFELTGYYQSKYIIANLVYVPNYSIDLGISKSVLNKKLLIRASITDIFNTDRMDYRSVTQNLVVNATQKYLTRRFSLNLVYNFGFGKKMDVKKVESGNSVEQNRINQ